MTVPQQDIVIKPVPGRGYLDDVFLIRHLAEQQVDSLFLRAPVPDGLRLLLFNEVDAGLGDVAFATKLMHLLRKHVPQLDIVLVSSGPNKQAQFGLPDGVSMYEFQSYRTHATTEHRQVDLVLSAPGIFDHCRSKEAVLSTLGLPVHTPFLFIAEYGSMRQLRDDAFKYFGSDLETLIDSHLDAVADREGVAAEQMGYRSSTGEIVSVTDGNVRSIGRLRAALASNSDNNPLWPWLVQPSLSARSAGFDVGEIGLFIEDDLVTSKDTKRPCREELLLTLGDTVVKELLTSSSAMGDIDPELAALYSGYAHSSHGFFLDYIALLEHDLSRPVNVVMPNARTAAQAFESIVNEAIIARLKDAGFGRIVVVGNSSDDSATTSESAPIEMVQRILGDGKALRLITRYPLPHADMRTLLQVSEPATMVSGDQSFSEAISAGKDVMVIEPVYCQTFHLDAQLALAERVSPDLRLVLEFAMQFKWEESTWQEVSNILRSGRCGSYFAEYNTLIHQEHRLNEHIVAVVKRAVLTASNTELRRVLTGLFSEAIQSFSTDDTCLLRRSALDAVSECLSDRAN